ncbi:MAG: Arm DNA-binding domain-containing protein [Desulfovibrio sp.]|nr:Arm DNA-binding domain-containing protein [Desulfovibrio sp.]
MPLTDTAIKALKLKAARYKVFDGGGLYLEVLPTGSKVWRIKYPEEGKDRRHTVGHYPAVSLRDAQLAVLNAKALLESGECLEPEDKALNPTFSATAFEWIECQAPRWSEAHKTTVTTRLQKLAFLPDLEARFQILSNLVRYIVTMMSSLHILLLLWEKAENFKN